MTQSTLAPFAACIERKSLVEVLRLLNKVIEKRNSVPILACVLLESTGDSVTIRGTDLDIAVSAQVPADAPASRAIAVDFAVLLAAASKGKGEFVTIADVGGERVTFRDGENGAMLRMPAREAADFPHMALNGLGNAFAFTAEELASDIDRVRVAVSTEETRYYLNGIFFHRTPDEYGNDVLRMAATDGHRLARITRTPPEGMPESFPDAIVPRKTCDVLAYALRKATGDVWTEFSTSKVRFRSKRVVIESKLIDGTFPDYSRVVPSVCLRSVTIDARMLADISKSVTAHTSGKNKAVKISLNTDARWLTAFATCPDNGPAMIEGEADYYHAESGYSGDFAIGFNSGYLAELMGKWGERAVALRMQDAGAPTLIVSDAAPEYVQVLMPMRVDGNEHSGTVCSPEYMKQLNRNPLDTFEADAPACIARLVEIEADVSLTGSYRRQARLKASRDLGSLVQGAITHLHGQHGGTRRTARLIVLLKLAAMRGENDCPAFYRLMAIYNHTAPASSYLAWERGIMGDSVASITAGDDEAVPVESPAPAPMPTPGEAVPVPEHATDVESEAPALNESASPLKAAGDHPATVGKPMFRTLQDFKAAAGIGSRWALRNWDSRKGEWGEERFVTVATVRARDIGFIGGDATALDVAAVTGQKGFGGRSWIGFPKQGDWESTPEGLRTLYRDGSPCMMICPAPLDVSAETGQLPNDDAGALRELVAAMGARLVRLERAAEHSDDGDGGLDVVGAESLPAASLGDPVTNSAPTVPLADYEAMQARAETAEAQLKAKSERLLIAEASNDAEYRKWKAERETLSGRAARAETRSSRLTAVLAGRKVQTAKLKADLAFARGHAARLERDSLPTTPAVFLVDATGEPLRKSA